MPLCQDKLMKGYRMKANRLKARPNVQTRIDLLEEVVANQDQVLRQMRLMYDNPEIHRIVGHALKREWEHCFYQFERQAAKRKKDLSSDLEIESDVTNDLAQEEFEKED